MVNREEALPEDMDPEKKNPVKVMLADDDKEDQEIFREALDEAAIPADLTTVNNGQELIDNLKNPEEPNPDIIFLDINMPLKNGKEVLEEIKKDEGLKEIPTVILSTSDSKKDIEDTFKAGADLYVRKPNSFNGFIIILKKIFSFGWAGRFFRPLWKTFFITEKNIKETDK